MKIDIFLTWRFYMKRFVCFLVMAGICVGAFAFDRSLNGSWGLSKDGEKEEFLRFNNNEISIMDTLFRESDYGKADNSIYIELEDESLLIQYYLLSPKTLLFIMTNTEDFSEAITLILSRL
jgi:hypothetical protein